MKYYGIVSPSGLGVYNDDEKLMDTEKYLRKYEVRDYKSQEKAVEDTIKRYNDQISKRDEIFGFYNEVGMKINWFYYKKNLK